MNTKSCRIAGPVAAAVLAVAGIPGVGAADSPLTAGDQRRWTLDFRARLEQPGGARPIEIGLTGEWVSTVSDLRPGEYVLALQLANARITGGGVPGAPDKAKDELERRLSRPFWATCRDDGQLLAFHFFRDVVTGDRNLLAMIAIESQLVRPPEQRPVWAVLERDAAGEHLAIYTSAEPNVVIKRKLKYVHTDGTAAAPAGALHIDVTQSELRFLLDPGGAVMTLDGANAMRVGVPFGNAAPLATITKIHLADSRTGQAPELIGSFARALPNLVTSPVVTQQPGPEQLRAENDDRLLEGHTTESLLEAAMANANDKMLPDRLAALFRRRPDAAAAALALLRKNGPQKQIMNALGAAGSPAAIETVVKLARDSTLPLPLRTDALNAFVFMQRPSVDAMRGPAALLDDDDARVASSARAVSGALARAGRPDHPDEADRIDQALIARYRKAREPRERSDLLTALGNSAGPAALPVIQEVLRNANDPARLSAVRALRLATGPDIDGLLSSIMTSDKDPSVRSGAIFAASFHHPVGPLLGEALVHAARTDPVDYVRSAAIALLRQTGTPPRTFPKPSRGSPNTTPNRACAASLRRRSPSFPVRKRMSEASADIEANVPTLAARGGTPVGRVANAAREPARSGDAGMRDIGEEP